MRILIIDPDTPSALYLERALREAFGLADSVPDVRSALVMLEDGDYDAVVLNVEGTLEARTEAIHRLRQHPTALPLIVLGADGPQDRVTLLRAGGDDHLALPYAFAELHIRLLGQITRRRQASQGATGDPTRDTTRDALLQVGPLTLDPSRGDALVAGQSLDLTMREFLLLQRLARHHGEVVPRDVLLEAAWEFSFDPTDHLIDRHMYRLRRKLRGHSRIDVVRGVGYRLHG